MTIDPKVTPIRHLETQKRPNAEPQGVPEALETLIRQQIKFCSVDPLLLHGFPSVSMDFFGFPWIYLDFFGFKHKKG